MTRKQFAAVVGISTALWNGLLLQIEGWARAKWEEPLHQSGKLADWWLLSGFLFIGGYLVIMVLLILLARKYLNARIVPVAASVLIDCAMMTVFWGTDSILQDPLLSGFLASVGLRYLHTVCFCTGILWFLIAFVRLRILFPPGRGEQHGSVKESARGPLGGEGGALLSLRQISTHG